MSDLITRLRAVGETTAEDFPLKSIEAWMLEAANTIESLQAEVAKHDKSITDAYEAMSQQGVEYRGEILKLQAELDTYKQGWVSVAVELPDSGKKVAVWVDDIFNPSKAYWTQLWFISGHWHKNAMDKAVFQGGLSVTKWMYITPPEGGEQHKDHIDIANDNGTTTRIVLLADRPEGGE